MDTEILELPFSDEPYDEEKAQSILRYTEEHFDSWLESLRQ